MRAVFLLCGCAALAGCVSLSSSATRVEPMSLHGDEAAMKAEVLRHVQPGMLVEDAKALMEAHGFKCAFERNWPWMSLEQPIPEDRVELVCSKYVPQETWWHNFFISSGVIVTVQFMDGKVTEVRVRWDHCCV